MVTIPSDTHAPGDTGHVTDHNNIADVLTSLTGAVATETTRAEAAEALLAPLASPSLTGTVTVTGQLVKVGPTSYTFTPVGSNSSYLLIDKAATAGDASLVLRDQGAIKGEVGLAADDNLHIKAVTGSPGSETFTDAILVLNSSANVEVVNQLGVGTSPAAQFHVAGAAGTGARTLAKLENTTGAGAGFDFVGDSPSVQWGMLTDIALNGGNNFGIFDLVAGYPPQVTVVGAGGGVAVGSDTVQPSAASSLDVVGSVQTRGVHGLSAMNFAGRGTTTGAPTSGTFQTGDVMADSAGVWFICTSGGTPGTWTSTSAARTSLGLGTGATASIDTTTGDIQASPGTAAAGASGLLADAKHVHPQPPMFAPAGLTGATAASRYVGATASGSPTGNPFLLGDHVIDQSGAIWVCITAGTPGTWARIGHLNVTAGNIAALGTQAAGGIGTAADAGHVHPTTGLVPVSGATLTGWLAPAFASLTFGSSIAVNAALGNAFAVTLTASTGTLANPTNPVNGQTIRVRVIQDGTGSRTLAYGTAYDFGTVGAPTLSTAASKVDILSFEYVASLTKWCYLGAGLGF